jgi:uncharacterized protein (TIGR03067 family)
MFPRVLGMSRTFALAMAALAPHFASAGDGRAPQTVSADDPLGALLTKHGYVAVPIDQTDPGRPIVHGSINGHPAVFIIDTGMTASTLPRDVVEKFKLPVTEHGKIKVSGAYTSGEAVRVTTTVERLVIGDAQMSHCQIDVDDWKAGLDAAARRKSEKDDPVVGILGDNTLAANQCVVDLGGGNLYIRRPGSASDRWLPYELAAFFAAEKYVEALCRKLDLLWLYCKAGGHDLSLIVDTGSPYMLFDHAVATRLGFKGTELPPDRGPKVAPGGKPTTSGPLPAPLILPGGFRVPEGTPVLAYDLTVLNRGLSEQEFPGADGLVGVDLLRHYSAVVDYSAYEPRLFLIDPSVKDQGMLVGRWEGVALEVSGRQMSADDANKCRLAIAGDLLDMQLWTGRQLVLTVDAMRPDSGPKTLDLSTSGRNGKRCYPAIYEVSRDQLRLCLPLDVKPGEKIERPKEFKSTPGSPYAVLTFRRVKPK